MRRFRRLVEEALDALPPQFRRALDNVEVVVEELPDEEVREQFGDLILGLYHGVPLTERSLSAPPLPDVISIYKKNIEAICASEEEIREEILATVMHEIGHHFGLDEDALEEV